MQKEEKGFLIISNQTKGSAKNLENLINSNLVCVTQTGVAMELLDWITEKIAAIEWKMEEGGEVMPLELKELFDSQRNGFLASYRDQFNESITKA